MPGLEVDEFNETDSSDNEESHSKLLNSVSQLDSTQRVKPALRKEVASEVSEYNLSKGLSNKNLINVEELAQVLSKKSKHVVISKKVQKVTKKSKTLPKPLEKPTEERLKRSIGFQNVKKQLRRWDAIVARNAIKDQICFPLNNNTVKMPKSNEFLSQFKTSTPLEEEIAKVLKQENQVEKETDENEFPLTLEEMLEKRKEMAQLRAKLSYKEAKAQRQSKIRSRKYHKLLKREKLRQQLKEFELLQKTDPEAALKKLSELDKTRAQERASLRHRNTGKWAKNLTVKAKYDVETRKVLAEQLKISKELTQKAKPLDESDDEQPIDTLKDDYSNQTTTFTPSTDNPWILDISKEVEDFVSGYKKFWDEKGKEISESKSNEEKHSDGKINEKNSNLTQSVKMCESNEETQELPKPKVIPGNNSKKKSKTKPKKEEAPVKIHSTSGVWLVTTISDECDSKKKKSKRNFCDIDTLFDELNDEMMKSAKKKIKKIEKKLKKTNTIKTTEKKKNAAVEFDLSLQNPHVVERPDMDVGLLEGGVENLISETEPANGGVTDCTSKAAPSIDPKNFIQIQPKKLRTYLPDNTLGDDETAIDDEKMQEKIIEEAFGDDDVLAEFKEMKEEEEKNSKIEIDTTLPGWGEWGGTGILPKRRKKRRLIINLPPRKDKLKRDLIINENENPNLSKHLVKEVPYPFKSVEAFEANIRAPIGRDWVPETAHQKLIQKQVVTKLGTIIEPMSENELISLNKASKSPYQGKKKENKVNNN